MEVESLAAASGYIQGKVSLIGFCIRWAHAGCYSGKHSIAFFVGIERAVSGLTGLLSEKGRPDTLIFRGAGDVCMLCSGCFSVGGSVAECQCGQLKMTAPCVCVMSWWVKNKNVCGACF